MTTAHHPVAVLPCDPEVPEDDYDTVPFGPAPAAATPGRPSARLGITVMMRASLAGFGLCWFTSQAVLALVLALWLDDARMPGAAGTNLALAAVSWWYLHYPAGVYEPATNTYIEIGPFGIWLRRRPRTPRQTLALREQRIVTTGRRPRTVLSAAWVRPGEWAAIACSVRKAPDRAVEAPAGLDRPGFLTHRQRAAGIAIAALAVGGLLHLGTQTVIGYIDDGEAQAAAPWPAVISAEGR